MCEAEPDTVGSYVEDFIIFIDCATLVPHIREFAVAGILEELGHSLMHVADETLARQIVYLLHPMVRLVRGQYGLTAGAQGRMSAPAMGLRRGPVARLRLPFLLGDCGAATSSLLMMQPSQSMLLEPSGFELEGHVNRQSKRCSAEKNKLSFAGSL